jgi:phosphoribosylformylglycinamidine synthase
VTTGPHPAGARVIVTLKGGILDPQGKAIEGALKALGIAGLGPVRQGKVFDIALGDVEPETARKALGEACERLLANTVIENFHIELR